MKQGPSKALVDFRGAVAWGWAVGRFLKVAARSALCSKGMNVVCFELVFHVYLGSGLVGVAGLAQMNILRFYVLWSKDGWVLGPSKSTTWFQQLVDLLVIF